MRVGIDSFTIRELKLNAYESFDYVKKLGLDGIQFGGIYELSKSGDIGELKEIKQYADSLGMYMETGVAGCNPVTFKRSEDEQRESISRDIRAFAQVGCHELRAVISHYDERYDHPVPWDVHLQKSAEFVRSLRPVLAECGSRINLENHGDSTFDILQVVEAAGEDICGVCFDTANTLVNAEDPVMAAKRVAPYTHMSHLKDGITFFTANGVSRQGKPPGQGVVDFAQIIPILGAYNRDLRLSIEDHKMIFEFRIFDSDWIAKNPKLTPYELGQYVRLAAAAEKKLASGELPGVDEYEATPYAEEMEQRLTDGGQYVRGLLNK